MLKPFVSVCRFDPGWPGAAPGQMVPPSAKVTCHHRLLRRPAGGGLTLPRGAVKVLTPCSLCTLVLWEGLVTGIATCSFLVRDDCPDCPQGYPTPLLLLLLPQPPQLHTERNGKRHHRGPQSTAGCRLTLGMSISAQSLLFLNLSW